MKHLILKFQFGGYSVKNDTITDPNGDKWVRTTNGGYTMVSPNLIYLAATKTTVSIPDGKGPVKPSKNAILLRQKELLQEIKLAGGIQGWYNLRKQEALKVLLDSEKLKDSEDETELAIYFGRNNLYRDQLNLYNRIVLWYNSIQKGNVTGLPKFSEKETGLSKNTTTKKAPILKGNNTQNTFDVRAFQNWVLQRNAFNKSKGYATTSLGGFGADGIMGKYTRAAYNLLKNEYNRYLRSGLTNYKNFYNRYIYKSPTDLIERGNDEMNLEIQNRFIDTEVNPIQLLKVEMPIIPKYTREDFVLGRMNTINSYNTTPTPLENTNNVSYTDMLNLNNTTKFALGGRMIPKYLNAGKLNWTPDYSQFQGKDEYWFKDAWLPLFDLWSAKAHFDNFFRPLFLKAVADNKIPSNLDYNTVRDKYFEDYMSKYYSQENTFPFRNAYRKNLMGPNGTQENWYFVLPNRFDPNGEWINYGNYNSNKYINGLNAYQNVQPEDTDSKKKLEASPQNIKNIWKGRVIEKNGKYYGYNPKTKHLFELQKAGNVYYYSGKVGNAVQVDPNTASALGYVQNTDGTFSLKPEEPPRVPAQPTAPTNTGLTELLVRQVVLDTLAKQLPQPTEDKKPEKPEVKEEPVVKEEPAVKPPTYLEIVENNTKFVGDNLNKAWFRRLYRKGFNDAVYNNSLYNPYTKTGSNIYDTNLETGYGKLDATTLLRLYAGEDHQLSRREFRRAYKDVKRNRTNVATANGNAYLSSINADSAIKPVNGSPATTNSETVYDPTGRYAAVLDGTYGDRGHYDSDVENHMRGLREGYGQM